MNSVLALLCLIFAVNASAADCDSVAGADSLLRPGVVLLLGEIHGTNEGPEAVAKLACAARAKGLPVTVGLELLVDDQERIDRYMASDGSKADRDSLIAGYFWQREYQDGRASQAMVDLIDSLRRYRTSDSASLRILTLDNPDAPDGRDRFMADRLLAAIAEDSGAFFVTLTGNIHNRRTIGTHFDPDYMPMGYLVWLESPEREVVSLEIAHAGGTAWVSTDQGFGVQQLHGEDDTPGILLYDGSAEDPYQGRLHVGAISAALPAKDR